VIDGGVGNDRVSGGWGNDEFFFEKYSGKDTITDFGHTVDANGHNMDQIVVNGDYLGATQSFLGTTLSFDYDDNGTSDGTVLLSGVRLADWQTWLSAPNESVLADTSGHYGDPTHVADVYNLWPNHSGLDGIWAL